MAIDAIVHIYVRDQIPPGLTGIIVVAVGTDLLHGMMILKNGCVTLVARCITGIEANRDVCRGYVVNNDPDVRDILKIFFIPNYNVKIGHTVYPMTDLSEQISQAGMEASGTGNMKFSMNGALTIGTLDGANVEIREEVGNENFFLFGLTVEEVMALQSAGYRPGDYYQNDPELKGAIDLIASGHFSHGDHELFRPIVDSLIYDDRYTVFADYRAYVDCQDLVGKAFQDKKNWTRMSILNAVRMGKFSSDRSIMDYSKKIWEVKPFPVELKWHRLPKDGVPLTSRKSGNAERRI